MKMVRQIDDSHNGVGRVVDPTKNVLDLVEAESKYQDAMREGESKYQDAMREAEARLQNAMREAEIRRIAELAQQQQSFEVELSMSLRASQDAAANLLAAQLQEVKNDLADRTAKLEQFRWETGGKTTAHGVIWGYIVGAVGITVGITTIIAFFLHNQPIR